MLSLGTCKLMLKQRLPNRDLEDQQVGTGGQMRTPNSALTSENFITSHGYLGFRVRVLKA